MLGRRHRCRVQPGRSEQLDDHFKIRNFERDVAASAGRPITQPGQTVFNNSEAESVQLAAESGFWDAGSPRRHLTILLAKLCRCTSVQIAAVEATNIEAIDSRPHRQAGC